MSKIKVAELFYSIQGEGRYMGVPSVFLRTFGCNFTCASFGMPKGEKSIEPDQIVKRIGEFSSYDMLPLAKTGCDSYASWHSGFKHLSPMLETDAIADAIIQTLPYKGWKDEHLVITGGEPLLGWQRSYPALLDHPKMKGLSELTFETNGTQMLTAEFKKYLLNWGLKTEWRDANAITFSVSPKLSCSGEDQAVSIRPDVIMDYADVGYTYLKFVVATDEDIAEAVAAVAKYRDAGFEGPVYLMPLGGVEQVYALNNRHVAEAAMRLGYRYSDRLQVPLFKNAWGT